MKKRLTVLLVLVLTTVLLFGCSSNQTQGTEQGETAEKKQPVRITLGHPNPESHSLHKGYVKFKELLESRTNGEFVVEIHSGGALGGDRVLAEGVDVGTIQMALNGSMQMGAYDSRFRVFDLPFIFDNNEDVDKIINGKIGERLLDVIPGTKIRVLAYPENGFRNISNNNRPIQTAEDLKGIKLRVMETPVHLATFEALGAIPTPVPFPEVYSALQAKMIDGQENANSLIYTSKYYEVQPYLTIPGPLFLLDMTIINEDFFQSLSKEHQDIIQQCALEAASYQREINRKENDEAISLLQNEGVEVTELPDEEIQKLKEAGKVVYKEFQNEIGADFLNEVLAELGREPFNY